ncbi:hypothetical protein ACS0TY_008988 [Phlomoides rotata]
MERNNWLFRRSSCAADDLGYKVADHRHQFLASARSQVGRASAGRGVDCWRPPGLGANKINVDASIKKGLEGVIDVDSAEALAVLQGLEFARQNRVDDVVVESDSQTAVFALNQRKNDLSYFGWIIRDIGRVSATFERVSFVWIRRGANSVAHKLAFSAFARSSSFFSYHIPTPVVGDVEA